MADEPLTLEARIAALETTVAEQAQAIGALNTSVGEHLARLDAWQRAWDALPRNRNWRGMPAEGLTTTAQ